MREDPGYLKELSDQLYQRYPDLLTAEKDLAILRGRMEIVRQFIHEPAWDDTARRQLAQALGLPEPTHPKNTKESQP
jgi:outer membrane protein TolC